MLKTGGDGMFLDIHNHGAWDIDDGMPSKADARQMLMMAQRDGIDTIMATPHMIPGQMDNEKFTVMNARIHDFVQLAKEYAISVYLGCELFLNHEYLTLIESSYFNPLAHSRYILAEFDVRKNIAYNDFAEEYLYEFQVRGYHVVIAHVERYFHEGIDCRRVEDWIASGHYIQVNRTSLLGLHGKQIQGNARTLLKQGLVHVIASDAHRATGDRICKLSDAYMYVKKKYGETHADYLLKVNPQKIIKDEPLLHMQKKKSFFTKLRGAK